MSKTKIWLKDVNFDFEPTENNPLGPHLAYTTPSQGGAASGLNDPLILKASSTKESTTEALDITKKAKEVGIILSMEDFLIKFFNMWREDAAALALLLGYESDIFERAKTEFEEYGWDWDYNQISDKLESVTLLKSLATGDKKYEDLDVIKQIEVLDMQEAIQKNLSQMTVSMRLDDFLDYFKELPEEEQEESFYYYEQRAEGMVPVLNEPFFEQRINDMDFMKSLSKEGISDLTEEQKLKIKLFQSDFEKGLLSGDSPEGEVEKGYKKKPNSKSKTIPKGEQNDMSEKDTKDVDLQKAVTEQADLIKALTAQVDQFKVEKEAAFEKEMVEKAKGFEFVSEEQAESVGKLLKSLQVEQVAVLMEVFGEAQSLLTKKAEEDANADMFVQKGASGEGKDLVKDEQALELLNKALGINKDK